MGDSRDRDSIRRLLPDDLRICRSEERSYMGRAVGVLQSADDGDQVSGCSTPVVSTTNLLSSTCRWIPVLAKIWLSCVWAVLTLIPREWAAFLRGCPSMRT